jgi:ankyrin repeat protein
MKIHLKCTKHLLITLFFLSSCISFGMQPRSIEHVNEQDSNGRTALHTAVSNNSDAEETYEEPYYDLLSGAIDYKVRIPYDLLEAAIRGNIAAIKKILKTEDVNEQDPSGRTALMQAIFSNNPDAVKLLLQAGADINAKDNEGLTALMLAASSSNYRITDIITLLLLYGADPNLTNHAGQTALDVAAEYHANPRVIELLYEATHPLSAPTIQLQQKRLLKQLND